MAYGQKNYSQIQGISGKYRISEIGCFLTSFCNLLQRFGMPVDPPTLNNIFKDRGVFIDVDDGIRDDLGWQSITAYNGQIGTTIKSGSVTERNSIVRIKADNSFGTHFCLVDSIRADGVYIVDSWDGVVKHSNVYGPITGWAVYTYIKPQPVGEAMITDKDNEYNRWNKLFVQIRGRKGSRNEFREAAVGRTWLRAMEILSDSPEADKATVAQQWALANRIAVEKQLADLKTALANEKAKPPVEVIKEVEKIVEKEVIKEVPVGEEEAVKGFLGRIADFLFERFKKG